jgi:hypothetical protein
LALGNKKVFEKNRGLISKFLADFMAFAATNPQLKFQKNIGFLAILEPI